MSDTTPPTPTTLVEWSRSEIYRDQLSSALRQPYMASTIAVLRQMNAPRAAETSDLNAVALCHQFHAGWEACLKALQGLPALDSSAFSKADKAGRLEAGGPWKWASIESSQKTPKP